MKFIKYPEIENSYRKLFLDAIVEHGFDTEEFVVQEKAHGANLSFWYDGSEMKSAKRSSFIKDNFYDYESVAEKYTPYVKNLYDALKADHFDFNILALYGELIGGTYPHKEVEKNTSATRIQKGIFYTPHNEFYAIDISLDGKLQDIDTFNKYMEQIGFIYAKTIFRGTLQECLEYPNKFQSKISQWMGLPEIPDNCCEGIVIKPVSPKFLVHGNRLILKNKNEKWAEKAKQKKRPQKAKLELSDEAKELWLKLESYATANRLRNVISKIGEIKKTDFGKLMASFSQDVLADFFKDHEHEFKSLEKKEQKHLTRQLNGECSKMIRKNLLNIVDGRF